MDMLLFLNVSVRHLLDQPLKKFFIRRLYFYLLSIHSCCNSNFGWQSLPYLLLTSMLHQENSFFVKNNFQCLLVYEKRNSIVAKPICAMCIFGSSTNTTTIWSKWAPWDIYVCQVGGLHFQAPRRPASPLEFATHLLFSVPQFVKKQYHYAIY